MVHSPGKSLLFGVSILSFVIATITVNIGKCPCSSAYRRQLVSLERPLTMHVVATACHGGIG